MGNKRGNEIKTKISRGVPLKKSGNVYAKFIEVFGLKIKNKSKHLYSKDGNTFLTTHQEALKIFKDNKVLFIGLGETTKIKIDNTDYLFFLRSSKAIEMSIVKKIEKVLGRKYFWIVSSNQERGVVAASNGEYAIITQVKHVKILF